MKPEILTELNDGKIFSATFIKRTTGEERRMLARRGVAPKNETKGRAWTDEDKNVFTVWDMEKGAYRCIPLEGVVRIKAHGKVIFKKD